MNFLWNLGIQRLGLTLIGRETSALLLNEASVLRCQTLCCTTKVSRVENDSDTRDTETAAKDKLEKLLSNPPTFCCQSGCNNCVWIEYAEELGKLCKDGGAEAKKVIEKHVTDPGLKAFLLTELKCRL